MTSLAVVTARRPATALKFSVMAWETSLLGRSVGRIDGVEALADIPEGADAVGTAEQNALDAGCSLLVSRVDAGSFTAIWTLEASGFLAVDVGVTFEYQLSRRTPVACSAVDVCMREAQAHDIPALQALVRGLFLTSYYYVTPFLSRAEADVLYGAWIANSIRERRADRVLLAEIAGGVAGFITCRCGDQNVGVIDLVGVAPGHGSQGVGKSLVNSALDWFRAQAMSTVHVRTQITNLPAVNMYLSTGARLQKADATFMKSLTERNGPR